MWQPAAAPGGPFPFPLGLLSDKLSVLAVRGVFLSGEWPESGAVEVMQGRHHNVLWEELFWRVKTPSSSGGRCGGAQMCVLILIAVFSLGLGLCVPTGIWLLDPPTQLYHHFSLCWLFCSLLLPLPAAPGGTGCYQQMVTSALTSFSTWTFLPTPPSLGSRSVRLHCWHQHCQKWPFVPAQFPAHGR